MAKFHVIMSEILSDHFPSTDINDGMEGMHSRQKKKK